MNGPCRVCEHPQRLAIDPVLADGADLNILAAHFDPIGVAEFREHRERHMQGVVQRVHSDPMELVRAIQDMRKAALCTVDHARTVAEKLHAIKTTLSCIEAEARITGIDKRFRPEDVLPWWREMRGRILRALEEHPDARAKILDAMQQAGQADAEPRRIQ